MGNNNINLGESQLSGIQYDLYDNIENTSIEIPGKLITVNALDNIYKLMNAKDLAWGFKLEQVKNISADIIDKYVNSYTTIFKPNGEDLYKRYEQDIDVAYLPDNSAEKINKLNSKPSWVNKENGIISGGIINSTQELIDIINFLLYRCVYLDEKVQELLVKDMARLIQFAYGKELSSNDLLNNSIYDPRDITITIKPVLNLTDGDKLITENSSCIYEFTLDIHDSITKRSIIDLGIFESFGANPEYDTRVINDTEELFNKPLVTSIQIKETENSNNSKSYKIIGRFVAKGFNVEATEHTVKMTFSVVDNTKYKLDITDEINRIFNITVKKIENKIRSIDINNIKYIYFNGQEIYKQVNGELDENGKPNECNNTSIFYYPGLIEEDILINKICEFVNVDNNKNYSFYVSNNYSANDILNWLDTNKLYYSYPLFNDNSTNFVNTFNSIKLKNSKTNTIKVNMDYDNENSKCKLDMFDTNVDYYLNVKTGSSSTLKIVNTDTNTEKPINIAKDNDNNFEKINDDNYKNFTLNLFSSYNTSINKNSNLILSMETTGTKYVGYNKYNSNYDGNSTSGTEFYNYLTGNPLSIKFTISQNENIFVIGNTELTGWGNININNGNMYENLYECGDGDLTNPLNDYPTVFNILRKENNETFDNDSHYNMIDGKYIRPIEVRIPLITDKSFEDKQYYNISKPLLETSKLYYWIDNQTGSEEEKANDIKCRLFNIVISNNIDFNSPDMDKYIMKNISFKTYKEDNNILNNDRYLEIDYEMSYKYFIECQDTYKTNSNNYDESYGEKTHTTRIINHNDLMSFNCNLNSITGDTNNSAEYNKGKAIIDKFVTLGEDKYNSGALMRKYLKINKVTSSIKTYFTTDYKEDYNHDNTNNNDEQRYFVPIVFKLKGKDSGNLLFDDYYFALHLIVTRGHNKLKCVNKTSEDISIYPSLNHDLDNIKYSDIYKYNINVNNYSKTDKQYKYFRITSRKDDTNDAPTPKLLLCIDNYKNGDINISNSNADLNFENYILNIFNKDINNSEIISNTDVVLNINNKEQKLYCVGIYNKLLTKDSEDRWKTPGQFEENIYGTLKYILTSDNMYNGYIDNEGLLYKFKRNLPDLLTIPCNNITRLTSFDGSVTHLQGAYGLIYININKPSVNLKSLSIQGESLSFLLNDIIVSSNTNITNEYCFNTSIIYDDIIDEYTDENDNTIEYIKNFRTEIKCFYITNDTEAKYYIETNNDIKNPTIYRNIECNEIISDNFEFNHDLLIDVNNNKTVRAKLEKTVTFANGDIVVEYFIDEKNDKKIKVTLNNISNYIYNDSNVLSGTQASSQYNYTTFVIYVLLPINGLYEAKSMRLKLTVVKER